ncbi:MAG: hypothetical protein ACRELY_29710 [Polyangiaceae bacterium]
MRATILVILPFALWIGCSSSSSTDSPGGVGGGGGSDAGATFDGDINGGDGGTTITTPDGGTFSAGNPDGSCSTGIPAGGLPVDVSHPATVVGTGDATGCTFDALNTAVSAGGIITFNCGSAATTIAVTATLNLPTNKDTVIDGGKKITLDGGGAVEVLRFDSPGFGTNESRLTLQHIAIVGGKTTPTDQIPTGRPAACSQGYDDGEGGGLYMRDGNLTIIDSIFASNQAALLGPDTGGGGFYLVGSKHGALVVSSTFQNNQAANGGGFGSLFAEIDVYDSLFTNNVATGHDANNVDQTAGHTQCPDMNNGQYELGSGGNGGALYNDGATDQNTGIVHNIVLCGDKIVSNNAGTNAFGGGVFFTSNDYSGTLSFIDVDMQGNTGGHWTNVKEGSVTNAGDAVGTNAKSITITNSSIQGVP